MVNKPSKKRIRRDGREEGLHGKHYCFSSPIHMQLLLGIMLPSGLSELHSCTEKVHCMDEEKQNLKETLTKRIGQKCCDTRKVVKRGK